MASQSRESRKRNARGQSQKGQVALEYVLLLVVAMGIALTLSHTFSSRDPENPGRLISRWHGLLGAVGADLID